ncbi:hypothetical protein [uncultured Gemmiger sp.]|uniref:hypothetical protein n=1 Tax=uncultured Gemmiger sp. TaxID=1623490 RepID=UPI0025F20D70|nr:hypothetical protein [uncultured Gemmiger sp.]
MKAEKSTMKIANFTIYRIFTRRKILTSNVYDLSALTVKLTARTGVLYSIPEIIRFAKGVRVEI